MVICMCVIEKVLERIMNIRMAIMAAIIGSTTVFTVHGADVSIPGANPKMPAVVYADNIVDQAKVEQTVKQLESALDKKFASELSVDDKNRVKRNILK